MLCSLSCLLSSPHAVLRVLNYLKSSRAEAGAPYNAREDTMLRRQEEWLDQFKSQPVVTQLARPKPTSDALREKASQGDEI